ncbi:DUF930 domain-containing protein [Rhizobium leguminosarum]|uniref:DUF930 domain-containing protein n=1 Tax=Rhizobium leguminosarum TaxID=384 RepID=UPI000FF448F5|nr:DUF930 domain-containing protein [Rhizobium leguminosarum]RWY87469.1 DUF930 domain-containing protein [Rhizobium leguminosarum]
MWLDAAGFRGHIAAVTEEDVEPAEMPHETGKQRPEIRWGVVASVVAHIPIIALLIFGLPKIEPKPAEDESVKVELVPPPEEKKPEEKKAEEKPPVPKPPEEAKKQPPPPPPPPPPPKAAKLPEAPGAPRPQRVARPVFEFAEKDSAPEQSERGMPQQAEAPKQPVVEARPEVALPVEPNQPEQPKVAETPPATTPMPQDVELPQVETAEVSPEKIGPAQTGRDEAETSFEQAKPPEDATEPAPLAPPQAKAKESDKITKAKTLLSQTAMANPTIETAIDNLPRSERINQLCRTELGQQLIHSPMRYRPLYLPSFPRAANGNVLDGKGGAFQNLGLWYNVTFTCEVDADARKVISFGFDVGDPVPKNQWKSRGFPED